jgi:putative two-component system response regulator
MENKQTILVVDDNPENIDILDNILHDEYNIKVALNGTKALDIARSDDTPDLILLDIIMPQMDGYEVCRRLKKSKITVNIPVIFITAMGEDMDEKKGFDVGAVDYITKPISPLIVKSRVGTHVQLYNQNRVLEQKVKQRTEELAFTQDATIISMATLAEYRDNETGGHIIRTKKYIALLARNLVHHPKFRDYLDTETIELLFKSALLHDIGKVGVLDSILLKPGKLDEEEFNEMKKHTVYGRDAIYMAEEALNQEREDSFLRYARDIAYSHHEKWDGTGYPEQLKGEDIPICGRIMAIADVYDALISKRVYKLPFPHEKAINIMAEGSGTQFDPDVVGVFLNIEDEFRKIALEFADYDEEREGLKKIGV